MENLLKEYISQTLGETGVLPAWKAFDQLGLPVKKSEEYKFTPITKLMEKQLDISSIKDVNIPDKLPGNTLIENALNVTFFNGKLVDSTNGLHPDIEIKSIDQSTFESQFKNVSDDPFYLLNQGINSEGIQIRIGKNRTIDQPIYIRYITDSSHSQVVSFPKLMIHAEENSEVSIIQQYQYFGDNSSFDSSNTHYILENNARVKSYVLQLDGSDQIHVGNTLIKQERDSNFDSVTLTMKGLLVRNNVYVSQTDEHCESHLTGLYMLNGSSHVDNHTVVDHKMPNSYSNELYKGILDEHSTGVFNGKIYVRPNAQNTNAFQSNKNLLLSENATLHTKPQLEIWADDVKCSHGCTSGQIDKEALFYLKTRGLSSSQALAIMLKAFVSEITDKISIQEIRNEIESKVDSLLFKP